jgi:hypothetical protein
LAIAQQLGKAAHGEDSCAAVTQAHYHPRFHEIHCVSAGLLLELDDVCVQFLAPQ